MLGRGPRASIDAMARALLVSWVALAGACTVAAGQPADPDPSPPLWPTQAVQPPAAGPEPTPPATAPARPPEAFLGAPDAPRIDALRRSAITRILRGRGGRSVAFRVELEDGTSGYFKPEQAISSTDWRAEILAYHLDRELGLGRVPPVTGRKISHGRIEAVMRATDPSRLSEIVVQEDGTVRGSLMDWIPGAVPELPLGSGWERWIRIDPPPAVTPFQRARTYAAQASGQATLPPPPIGRAASAPDRPDRPAELADLIVFDHLAHNIDRWGGGFANLRTRGRGGPLVFLDNAAGFSPYRARIGFMDARLRTLQRFRRSTIDAVRRLSVDALRRRVTDDPAGPSFDPRVFEHLELRRRDVLEHVASMYARHGERIWLDEAPPDARVATQAP